MCGILAIATGVGGRVTLDDDAIARMRDRMVHRGPDGAGLWRDGHVALAHRRLAVIDPTPSGAQPMRSPDGRCTLSYNGELYNDAELRAGLARLGWRFRTSCDTETVLAALATWGDGALRRLRGMNALAFHDRAAETLLLARDPLGVKPLYWWRGTARGDGRESIVAASEIPAILEHPGIDPAPDYPGISAYLTTIRTSLGERTMFEGVRAVRPGEAIEVSLGGASLGVRRWSHWPAGGRSVEDADDGRVRDVVRASVVRHLRSDVPACALLSGGLDSSIIVNIAREHVASLRTYCAGCPGDGGEGDFEHARLVAAHLGVSHTEAPVTREAFVDRWSDMVERMGMPLSTPNEVAINEVARTLRTEGHVVAVGGEGADELFGGYGPAMSTCAASVAAGSDDPAMCQLALASWVPLEGKAAVLAPAAWRGVEGDAALLEAWREAYEEARAGGPDDPLQAHLRFQRRVNLEGLLGRLDRATMLEGVEGRTPLADRAVADLAERLPMARKFAWAGPDRLTPASSTKIALRTAFADALPLEVVGRAKASFPLPFRGWMGEAAAALREGEFARALFTEAAIETVSRAPERLWNLSWPMINVAMWGRRWFG